MLYKYKDINNPIEGNLKFQHGGSHLSQQKLVKLKLIIVVYSRDFYCSKL